MFRWSYSESVETDATAEQIWAMWEDVVNWPAWDSELEWVRLNGDFQQGTEGQMKPAGAPVVDFTLIEVCHNSCFVDRAKLPLTTLDFSHNYEMGSTDRRAMIHHSVEMKGFLAPLFGFVLGRKIKAHLRDAMEELSRRALTVDTSKA